jgi:hypothetical protein
MSIHKCRRVLQWIGTKPWPVPKEELSPFNIVGRFLDIVRSEK